jgi:hypothetical protein
MKGHTLTASYGRQELPNSGSTGVSGDSGRLNVVKVQKRTNQIVGFGRS